MVSIPALSFLIRITEILIGSSDVYIINLSRPLYGAVFTQKKNVVSKRWREIMYRDESKNLVEFPLVPNVYYFKNLTTTVLFTRRSLSSSDFYEGLITIYLDDMIETLNLKSGYHIINVPLYYVTSTYFNSERFVIRVQIPSNFNSNGYFVDINGYIVMVQSSSGYVEPFIQQLTSGLYHKNYSDLSNSAITPAQYNDYRALFINNQKLDYNDIYGHIQLTFEI